MESITVRMIVFAVLTDPSGVTANMCGARGDLREGVIVVHRTEHQLPLFVVTYRLATLPCHECAYQELTLSAQPATQSATGGASGAGRRKENVATTTSASARQVLRSATSW